jgi:beta-glucosidase
MICPMGFPDGFFWGTAASSTQTEGAAPRSDWARWEAEGRVPPSGDGNGFATEFRTDFAAFAEHGLTHHRLSIEWARIEPSEGRRDPDAIEHYLEVLRAARDAGLSVWVCLHHFTLPGWFADDLGGFLDERARSYHWARHVDWMGETFGDLVYGWKPINEPVAYAGAGWLLGMYPPGRTDLEEFGRALAATLLAQHEAWRLLRSGDQPVATVMNLSPIYPAVRGRDPAEREGAEAMARAVDDVYWGSWIRALRDGVVATPGTGEREVPEMAGSFDLIGFSYYSAQAVYADATTGPYPTDARATSMGYAPWPEGLGLVLRRLADELPGRALLVAECGLGTEPVDGPGGLDDQPRVRYLDECIGIVADAIDDGVDVRGFFHWTGVDNYEWDHGFDVQFGLFDRARAAKASAALAARYANMRG